MNTAPAWVTAAATARVALDPELLAAYGAKLKTADAEYAHIEFPDMLVAASWASACKLQDRTWVSMGKPSFASRLIVQVRLT